MPLVIVCLVLLAPGCKRAGDGDPPAPDTADLRARDRAQTMVDRGRACDAGDPARRDLDACRQACALGHSNSCGWLGDAHARGLGVVVDYPRAMARYREACRGGSGLGCEGIARLIGGGHHAGDRGEVDRRYAEARTVYRVHCSQRHAASCSRLGRLYADGLGGTAATDVAVTYWQRACALGSDADCRRIRDPR